METKVKSLLLTMFVENRRFEGDCYRLIIRDSGGALAKDIESADIIVCSDRWEFEDANKRFPDKGFVIFSVNDPGQRLPSNCRWIDGPQAHMFKVISHMTREQFTANCRLTNLVRLAPEPMFPEKAFA